MKILGVFIITTAIIAVSTERTIKFANRCQEDIWISPLTNDQGPILSPGIVQVAVGSDTTYNIPDAGWGGRFWPKMGCDGSGENCKVGQSIQPCPDGGCQPPGDTKVEFFFPPAGDATETWYDISLVDGYSIAAEITPSKTGGSCTQTNCAVSLDKCPTEDEVGDLKWQKDGKTVQCLSPCKKWNFPPPYGLGKPETEGNGLWYCCPTPPVTPEECRANIVVNTKYVTLVHQDCPTAYAYSYDDEAGLHNCPNDANYEVNFC